MQIHDLTAVTQSTWTQLDTLPTTPRVVLLSASSDFRVGYGDTEPTNNWVHVEVNGQMPFAFAVADPSKLWAYSSSGTAGDRDICAMTYKPGEGPIPYC
jgi:hypothetical protein